MMDGFPGWTRWTSRTRRRAALPLELAIACGLFLCGLIPGGAFGASSTVEPQIGESQQAAFAPFLDDLEERTFRFFWETANPKNGLIPDRYPTPSFASIAAVGFGLTAYPIGVERGYVTREAARRSRARDAALLRRARRTGTGSSITSSTCKTGARANDVELSTVDTALLLAGVLFCQSYFDAPDPAGGRDPSSPMRSTGASTGPGCSRAPPAVALAWPPEQGFSATTGTATTRRCSCILLALGSPTYPVDPQAWALWTIELRRSLGHALRSDAPGFPPLFGHQYTPRVGRLPRHPRLVHAPVTVSTTSRTAGAPPSRSRRYAIAQPQGLDRTTAPNVWGMSACDGPGPTMRLTSVQDAPLPCGYAARGVASIVMTARSRRPPPSLAAVRPRDRACPAPSRCIVASARSDLSRLRLRRRLQPELPASTRPSPARGGRLGWVDVDYLGIDQGADPGDDRELPQRADLAGHAEQPVSARGPRARRVHRRLACTAAIAPFAWRATQVPCAR